jgi:mRNA-degrading endonuclease toxin of MazEF toxin-antitoxin module
MRIPKRGEIWQVNLSPAAGSEQQGVRPVLVITNKEFNQTGLMIVCPITQGGNYSRLAGFAASLSNSGTKTQGVVLCNQLRTVDYRARESKFFEVAPPFVVDDVLARLSAILE